MIGAHVPRPFLYDNLERGCPVMNAEPSSWQSLGQLLHEQARRFGSRTLFRFEGAGARATNGSESADARRPQAPAAEGAPAQGI